MDVIRVASDPDCRATERIERATQIYSSRSELILTRSVREGHNSFPRLRFGLVRNVSLSTARSIVEHTFAMFGQDEWLAVFRAEHQMDDNS